MALTPTSEQPSWYWHGTQGSHSRMGAKQGIRLLTKSGMGTCGMAFSPGTHRAQMVGGGKTPWMKGVW